MDRTELPPSIASVLEPDEPVQATFSMNDGVAIYATDRRLFSQRGELVAEIAYRDVAGVKQRAPFGSVRVIAGVGFLGAGVITGFETPEATVIALLLLLVGSIFILLGTLRRTAWVELDIRHEEQRPSLGHIAMFLPFWLLLRSGKRYKVVGRPAEVDALFEFLKGKALGPAVTGSPDTG